MVRGFESDYGACEIVVGTPTKQAFAPEEGLNIAYIQRTMVPLADNHLSIMSVPTASCVQLKHRVYGN